MKVVLIGVTIVSVLFLTQKVTSYSVAVVKSDTSIKITDQRDALISAIADSSVKVTPGEISEFTINISNRATSSIDLKGETVTLDGITFTYEDKTFRGDEKIPLSIKVESENVTIKAQTIQLPLHFKWENGEAVIPAEIDIEIQGN